MDIVILANFCGDLTGGGNNRFLYLAELLAKDHAVELITSDYDHGAKAYREEPLPERPFQVTLLHESGYPKNVCLKRFASHRVWGKNVEAYLKTREKPDVIYCAVPSLSGPLAAAEYCRNNKTRFVIDVQDLWPEAFQMVVNIPVISPLAFRPFRGMADRIYGAADAVCAVSRTYVERALSVNRKCGDGVCVYLGTKLETFDANARANAVSDKPAEELWLGYCGTLGASYDLTCVFDALALLRERGSVPPKFIVMGDGPRREEFERYAREKALNVEFTGRLPYDRMCGRLRACDIVVNPIIGSSAASIINKHADYAASGLPVLNTQASPEYQALVEEYGMGFNCASGDAADLADKLRRLMEDAALRKTMGANARRCGEERFDRKNSYQALVDAITGGTDAKE